MDDLKNTDKYQLGIGTVNREGSANGALSIVLFHL